MSFNGDSTSVQLQRSTSSAVGSSLACAPAILLPPQVTPVLLAYSLSLSLGTFPANDTDSTYASILNLWEECVLPPTQAAGTSKVGWGP